MTYAELLTFARRHEGMTLETVTGRRFRLGSYLDSIVFVPESTGLGRTEGRKGQGRFVARYAERSAAGGAPADGARSRVNAVGSSGA